MAIMMCTLLILLVLVESAEAQRGGKKIPGPKPNPKCPTCTLAPRIPTPEKLEVKKFSTSERLIIAAKLLYKPDFKTELVNYVSEQMRAINDLSNLGPLAAKLIATLRVIPYENLIMEKLLRGAI